MKQQNTHPWIDFPPNLPPVKVRSLCLLFILEEISDKLLELHRLNGLEKTQKNLEIENFLSSANTDVAAFPDKLCFYCNILLKASKIHEHSLDIRLDAMKRFSLEFRLKILNSQTSFEEKFPNEEFFDQFKGLFRLFFFSLNPFLVEARSDENVLLKLIDARKILNLLEPNLIEKTLLSFFPNSFENLKTIIHEGLTKRGFSLVYKENQNSIDEILREQLCPKIQE